MPSSQRFHFLVTFVGHVHLTCLFFSQRLWLHLVCCCGVAFLMLHWDTHIGCNYGHSSGMSIISLSDQTYMYATIRIVFLFFSCLLFFQNIKMSFLMLFSFLSDTPASAPSLQAWMDHLRRTTTERQATLKNLPSALRSSCVHTLQCASHFETRERAWLFTQSPRRWPAPYIYSVSPISVHCVWWNVFVFFC